MDFTLETEVRTTLMMKSCEGYDDALEGRPKPKPKSR
jgi:hypothetical protein